jgi:DNA-binding transcriptional regulator YdaS (Cro superfamily)
MATAKAATARSTSSASARKGNAATKRARTATKPSPAVKARGGKRAPAKKAPAKNAPAKRAGNVITPPAWGPAARTEELAKALGGVTALARALGVSPSQPSRWKSGKEQPGPEAARRLIDLDHVVARASLVWHPDVIPVWLRSSNGHLNGQSPLGVLMTRGPAEVIRALDATEAGGFA